MGLIKQGETEEAAAIRKRIIKIQKSKAYKLSRIIGFIPRKLHGRDYLPIPEKGADTAALEKKLKSITNSRTYMLSAAFIRVLKKIMSLLK